MHQTKLVCLLIIIFSGCHYSGKNKQAMENKDKQKIIEHFVDAYNRFDVTGMIKDLHQNIIFENISNGQVDLTTKGIHEFKKQAEDTKTYFKERHMKITDMVFGSGCVEVTIDYMGILAKDLPGGLKSGDTLRLNGRSVYRFRDNKIINIKDISD